MDGSWERKKEQMVMREGQARSTYNCSLYIQMMKEKHSNKNTSKKNHGYGRRISRNTSELILCTGTCVLLLHGVKDDELATFCGELRHAPKSAH